LTLEYRAVTDQNR